MNTTDAAAASAVNVVCAVAVLAPVLLVTMPPLLDYPAHIAGVRILHDLLTARAFSDFYQLNIVPVPNLALTAVTLPLVFGGMSVEAAGRIALALTMIAIPLGVMRVHRALFARVSWVPALSWIFVYNHVLMFGFMNYLAGAGLALLGFGGWLRVREGGVVRRVVSIGAWLVVCFFAHLTAAFVLLGLIISFEVSTRTLVVVRRQGAPSAVTTWVAPLALAVCLLAGLFTVVPRDSSASASITSGVAGALGSMTDRLRDLPNVTLGYAPGLEKMCEIALAAALLGLAVAGRLGIEPRMVMAVAGLGAVYFVVPHDWAATTFIPERLPLLILALALASFDVRGGRVFSAVANSLVLLLVLARSGAALQDWGAADRDYAPIVAALSDLPRGARVYGTLGSHASIARGEARPWGHMDSYAALRSVAYASSVFASPSQDLIVRTPSYAAIARRSSPLPDDALETGRVAADYDYVLAVRMAGEPTTPGPRMQSLARSGSVVLYRLTRGDAR